MQKRVWGIICSIISAVGFGTLGIWSKAAYSAGLSPADILTMRFSVATVFLIPLVLLFAREDAKLSFKQIAYLAVQGGIMYAFVAYLYFMSFSLINVALATTIFFTHPIYTYFLSAKILKKRISPVSWLLLIILFIGIVLVIDLKVADLSSSLSGIIYAAFASLGYSFFNLSNEIRPFKVNTLVSTTVITAFAALTLNILTGFGIREIVHYSAFQLFVVSGVALVGTVIAIYTLIIAIRSVGSNMVAVLSVFDPLTGAVLAALIFHESLNIKQMIGIVIILIAVVITSLMPEQSETVSQKE